MSLNSEITRLENAKTTLKTKLNSRNDNQHQITNELIDEYGDFVDSIPEREIDWSEIGYSETPQFVQDGYDYAKTIYDNWDSSRLSFYSMFANDESLIFMPLVDTSNGTDFLWMFGYCQALITIPQLDTSNGTTFQSMFASCSSLTTIPQLNTSSGTDFISMFQYCTSLTTIPQLDTSSGTDFLWMFDSCSSLITFGGLKNIGQAYSTNSSANNRSYKLNLEDSSRLTHDSLMNVINNLYDIATKGCNTQQLVLGSTNLAKLSASEISTATNKGWSVS